MSKKYLRKQANHLTPQCFNGKMAFAVTNRGHLIPCCRCDDPDTMNDAKFQQLLRVSKISNNNTIDNILKTPEWQHFYLNLTKHKGAPACYRTCSKNKPEDDIQEVKLIDLDTGKDKWNQKR